MPNSIVYKGKVLDFKYKRNKVLKFLYVFYVGDMLIGQLFLVNKSWTAVSNRVPCVYGAVGGFKTRQHASEFLLAVCKLI